MEITKLLEEAETADALRGDEAGLLIDRLAATLRRLTSGEVPGEDAKLVEEARGALSFRSDEAGLLLGLLTDALERAHFQITGLQASVNEHHAMLRDADAALGEKRQALDAEKAASEQLARDLIEANNRESAALAEIKRGGDDYLRLREQADAAMNERDAAIKERDEARAEGEVHRKLHEEMAAAAYDRGEDRARIVALEQERDQLAAACAALRQEVVWKREDVAGGMDLSALEEDEKTEALRRIDAVLAPDAGRSLLERLERAETRSSALDHVGEQREQLIADLTAARARVAELERDAQRSSIAQLTRQVYDENARLRERELASLKALRLLKDWINHHHSYCDAEGDADCDCLTAVNILDAALAEDAGAPKEDIRQAVESAGAGGESRTPGRPRSEHGWCPACRLPCFVLHGQCRGCGSTAVVAPPGWISPEVGASVREGLKEAQENLQYFRDNATYTYSHIENAQGEVDKALALLAPEGGGA